MEMTMALNVVATKFCFGISNDGGTHRDKERMKKEKFTLMLAKL